MPDGLTYNRFGGFADMDFVAMGGVFKSPPHAGGAPGFRLGMIGPQWTFVDPEGKVWIWKGVFNVSRDSPHILGGTNQAGRSLKTTTDAKYGPTNASAAWQTATKDRLRRWHFNALGPFSNPIYSDMPFMWHNGISMYARHKPFALAAGLTDAVKDISRCMKQNAPGASTLFYRPSGASSVGWPDALDPKYAQFISKSVGSLALHPFMVGYAFEESDCVSRWFTNGHPDERAEAGCPTALNALSSIGLHLGMGILWSQLEVSASVSPRDGTMQTYADKTNYSKKKLIDNLKAEFGNSIANLNAAWNTNNYYTTFDSDGGWGAGRGLADEDGLRPRTWFGAGSATHTGHPNAAENNVVNSMSWHPAVKRALDRIYGESVEAWLKPAWDTLKARDPGLLFAPVNNWGVPFRKAAIEPLKKYTDFFMGGTLVNIRAGVDYPKEIAPIQMNWHYGAVPRPAIAGWYSAPGRDDSDLYYMGPNYNLTHEASAKNENIMLRTFTHGFKTTDGVYPHLGHTKWGGYDQINEKLVWGLFTLNDNAKDGRNYTVPQPDPWTPGRQAFTEDKVFTDYLGYGGTTTLQRHDLIVGANIALHDIFAAHFAEAGGPGPNPEPPDPEEPPMADQTVLFAPVAAGHLNEWLGSFADLADANDATARLSDTNDQRFVEKVGDVGAAAIPDGATIAYVAVEYRLSGLGIRPLLSDGVSVIEHATFAGDGTPEIKVFEALWATDPFTGQPWTLATLRGWGATRQFGVRNVGPGVTRVHRMAVRVGFTPAGVPVPVPPSTYVAALEDSASKYHNLTVAQVRKALTP